MDLRKSKLIFYISIYISTFKVILIIFILFDKMDLFISKYTTLFNI